MDKSLRQKRSGKLKISAPTLISAPASATTNTIAIQSSQPPSSSTSRREGIAPGTAAALRLVANGSTESIPRSVMSTRSKDDRTADMVKRRYSTRFNQLPDIDLPAMPAVPAMHAMYAPRKLSSRDGEMPKGTRTLQIEPGMLQEGNFRAEECTAFDQVQ
jgi:exocyst complex component 8